MTSKLCARPVFVDISHWQTLIGDSYSAALSSLERLKDSGVVGLIHKATEGLTFVDDKFQARCDLCRDAGLLFGSYHFLRPGNMGEQVAFYFDQVASVQKVANEEASWIFACDYEDPNVPLSDVAYFCEQLEAVIGRPPVLYTGFATKDKIKAGQDPTRLTRFPLWLAHYASEPVLPEGWDKYWGWQYSEKASVPGIVAPTDTNAAWEGATEEEFIESWTGQAAIDVIPEPPDGGDPALKPAEVHLWVPPGTALSLVVNGSIVYEGKAP